MTTPAAHDWPQLLADVPLDWALIPLNGRKCPINPETGLPLQEWTAQAGYSLEQLAAMNGMVRAVGVLLGPASGGLLAVDFDGPGATEKFIEITGHSPDDLPPTIATTSGRHKRQQRLFTVDLDWVEHLRSRKFTGATGATVLEFRWAGQQSAIAGDHPETTGYHWCDGCSPSDLEPAPAPEWLLQAVVTGGMPTAPEPSPARSNSDDRERALRMLDCLPPSAFESYDDWLTVGMALHGTDPGLLTDWVEWCRPMVNFDEAECLQKWQSFGRYPGRGRTIATLHHLAQQHGYREPKRSQPTPPAPTHREEEDIHDDDRTPVGDTHSLPPIDLWDHDLAALVDPTHPLYERNTVRRQIKAATLAADYSLKASPQQVRSRLIQKQRELIAGTSEKGTAGGEATSFSEKKWLIQNLIAEGCLTGVAAYAKVGKTKFVAALAAALIHQQPFMGNPSWLPAPGTHKLILWWTDQPGVDSAAYLRAVGLMDQHGVLHPQIIRLYTEDDDLCWDDQGIDELIRVTSANPGAVVISDSFYANVQRIYGSDQEAEAGGALIDVQTLLSQGGHTHVCCFHSSKETGKVGVEAIRGHSSAAGVPSAVISLHFIERKCPTGSGKWVADKEKPYRRMVTEGRLPYSDLLVHLDGASGNWRVLGQFQQALAELQGNERNSAALSRLTQGQRETLEWIGSAMGLWKNSHGVTALQVAAAKIHHLRRQPTQSEVEITRKQLVALHKAGLLTKHQHHNTTHWNYRTQDG